MNFARGFVLSSVFWVVSCMHPTHEAPPIHKRMLELVKNFDRFDTSGDGYLSRAEFENGANSDGQKRLTQDQLNRAFQIYDRNGDHKISRKETQVAAENGPVLFEN